MNNVTGMLMKHVQYNVNTHVVYTDNIVPY